MRLTFFGSSLVSAYWNGAATYYRGLLAALARHGHEIVFCEPDAFDRQAHRDLETDPDYARVLVYSTAAERDRLVARALRSSDWVFKCSGVGIWDEELEAAISGGGPARTAFWDVDAPATLAHMRSAAGSALRALIPGFDHVFTYGGGPPVVAGYLAVGARACEPVYNGLDPDAHRREESEPTWDLLFMGNRLPDRDERVQEFFVGPAATLPDHRFALGGSGWDDVPLPANVARLGHVPTGDHNRLNAASRLVLNIHRAPMVRNGWSPATRMFEAAGAAACQITDAWRGIGAFFEPGREILVARNGGDVVRLLKTVPAEQAERIGRAAQERALREHTYARRAERVHRLLRGAAPPSRRTDAAVGARAAAAEEALP
jgi:spore maturation protein CgeB